MGEVLPDDADSALLATSIESVLQVGRGCWYERARALVAANEVFSMHQSAVSDIEAHCAGRLGA